MRTTTQQLLLSLNLGCQAALPEAHDATSYVMKLIVLTHQNIRVLRHFRHCRAIEPSKRPSKSQFRAASLYKDTLQQSRQLFSPLRASQNATTQTNNRTFSLPSVVTPSVPVFTAEEEGNPRPSSPQMRRKGWHRLRSGVLWLRHTPHRLMSQWKSRRHERKFRAKVRTLRRQEQTIFLREQHRIATSTQAALFLSLVSKIDLKATTELAVLCQHVTKQRRRKKMTTEDLSCFDQTLSAIESNYETVLTTVQ
ncbi:MAG: hypothetical protein FJ147_28210 [Deltaproteobacteria bacterium]|nr:hypothetical protein [Deltaproteobacteria bacterium]